MDHRTIVSFFTCQLVWVNRYVERVRLTVDPANPAQRLYLRLGYQQLAEERGYFGPGEDRLLLEKALI